MRACRLERTDPDLGAFIAFHIHRPEQGEPTSIGHDDGVRGIQRFDEAARAVVEPVPRLCVLGPIVAEDQVERITARDARAGHRLVRGSWLPEKGGCDRLRAAAKRDQQRARVTAPDEELPVVQPQRAAQIAQPPQAKTPGDDLFKLAAVHVHDVGRACG